MTIISLALAPMLALQGVTENPIAIKNDNPETWVVEYPKLIQPQVTEYRGCLTSSNRIVRGKDDFEEQHRSDVPRCDEVRAESISQANEILAGAKTTLTPDQVDELFTRIGLIHIARGRDLDEQFRMRIAGTDTARDQYESQRPKGLVIELIDGSVVKARAEVAGQKGNSE